MFEQCADWRAVYATDEIAQRLGADWDRVIFALIAKCERHLKSTIEAPQTRLVGKIVSERVNYGPV